MPGPPHTPHSSSSSHEPSSTTASGSKLQAAGSAHPSRQVDPSPPHTPHSSSTLSSQSQAPSGMPGPSHSPHSSATLPSQSHVPGNGSLQPHSKTAPGLPHTPHSSNSWQEPSSNNAFGLMLHAAGSVHPPSQSLLPPHTPQSSSTLPSQSHSPSGMPGPAHTPHSSFTFPSQSHVPGKMSKQPQSKMAPGPPQTPHSSSTSHEPSSVKAEGSKLQADGSVHPSQPEPSPPHIRHKRPPHCLHNRIHLRRNERTVTVACAGGRVLPSQSHQPWSSANKHVPSSVWAVGEKLHAPGSVQPNALSLRQRTKPPNAEDAPKGEKGARSL